MSNTHPVTRSSLQPPANQNTVSIFEFDVGGKLLGTGSFSEVVIAKRYKDNKLYAIKQINKFHAQRKNVVKYVVNERRVLLSLSHPAILKLHWTSRDEQHVYMIYEYINNGELWEMIQKFPNKVVPLDLAKHWLAEIVLGLEYLHKRGIAHRDLKPENILLTDDFHIKIIDFGTSKVLNELPLEAKHKEEVRKRAENKIDKINKEKEMEKEKQKEKEKGKEGETGGEGEKKADDKEPAYGPTAPLPPNVSLMSEEEHRRKSIMYSTHRLNSFTGTPEYMAPEVVNSKPVPGAGASCDLWSLGIIIYQLLTGTLPFTGGSAYLVFQSTLKGDYPIPSSLPPSALSLITSLLNTDPLLRPGVATSSMATHINPIVDTAAGSVQPPPIGNTKTGSSTSTTPTTATPPTTSDTNTTNPTTQTTSTPSQASQQLSSSSRYSSLDEIESLVNETAIKAETSQSSSYTTFTSIKTHPFFEGIDWDNLFNQQVPRIDELRRLRGVSIPQEEKEENNNKKKNDVITIEDLEKEFQEVDDEELMKSVDGVTHVLERVEYSEVKSVLNNNNNNNNNINNDNNGDNKPVIQLLDDNGEVVLPE